MANKKTIRMNLEMSPLVRTKLEVMSEKMDESLSQVLRRSVSILDLLLTETSKGGTIIIRSADGVEKQVVIT
jgi:hypothetical protein